MKKLLLLLMIVFLPLCMNAQRVFRYDSIPMPTGDDTTIYIPMFDIYNWGLTLNYDDLDEVDGTMDLGGCNVADGTEFNRLDDLRLPFTLADSTVAFEKSNYSFKFLALFFVKVSCSTGTQFYRIARW